MEPRNRVSGVTVRLLLQETSRSDHPVAMNFRGLGARSKSGRQLLGHCAFLRRFRTEPRNRVWGITVRLLLQETSILNQLVARCRLSRPRTPFQVRSSLSRPLCLSSAFWDGTKIPSLGRHRSAFVGKKLRDRTTQLLDVDFRGRGARSKSDRPFPGHCSFLRRFGMEPRNRVWASPFEFCCKKLRDRTTQ